MKLTVSRWVEKFSKTIPQGTIDLFMVLHDYKLIVFIHEYINTTIELKNYIRDLLMDSLFTDVNYDVNYGLLLYLVDSYYIFNMHE